MQRIFPINDTENVTSLLGRLRLNFCVMPLCPLLPPSSPPRTTWNITVLFWISGIPAVGIHSQCALEIKTYSRLTGRICQLILKGQFLDVENTLHLYNQLFLPPETAAQEESPSYNLIWKLNRTINNKHELTLKDTSWSASSRLVVMQKLCRVGTFESFIHCPRLAEGERLCGEHNHFPLWQTANKCRDKKDFHQSPQVTMWHWKMKGSKVLTKIYNIIPLPCRASW